MNGAANVMGQRAGRANLQCAEVPGQWCLSRVGPALMFRRMAHDPTHLPRAGDLSPE